MAKYFVRTRGELRGPFDKDEVMRMAAGARLNPDDLIRDAGQPKWFRADEIKGYVPPVQRLTNANGEHWLARHKLAAIPIIFLLLAIPLGIWISLENAPEQSSPPIASVESSGTRYDQAFRQISEPAPGRTLNESWRENSIHKNRQPLPTSPSTGVNRSANLAVPQQSRPQDDYSDLLHRAEVAYAAGDLRKASALLQEYLASNISDHLGWYALSRIQQKNLHYTDALYSIIRATQLDSRNADYIEQRVRVLLDLGRGNEALSQVNILSARDIGAQDHVVVELKGLALAAAERYSEAEPLLSRSMRRAPNLQVGISLTDALESRGAWLDSAEVYQQLERLDSGSRDYWRSWRAYMHTLHAQEAHQSDHLDEAIQHYKIAHRMQPDEKIAKQIERVLVSALSLRALSLIDDREFVLARQIAGEISRHDPDHGSEVISLIAQAESLDRRSREADRQSETPDSAPPATTRTVQSRIDGEFNGFDHGNIYELDNGQIWRQTEFHISVRIRIRPRVTITKEGVHWTMTVDGIDRPVRVERIDDIPGVTRSRIRSDFDGFEHGNIYELDNGQTWQQTDFHIRVRIAVHPRVIIFKDGARWMMKVDGIDRAVSVERIK